jgi:4-hydroxymandelate oxidase
MPGMGGVQNNENFRRNYNGWELCRKQVPELIQNYYDHTAVSLEKNIRLAPITGAVENIGFPDEQSFYYSMIFSAHKAGIRLSIGDGCPDIKLQSGIGALTWLQKTDPDTRAAVFIKPYANERIIERIEWAAPVAETVGIDIDAYSIVTMRNLVKLEHKTADQLLSIKKRLSVPFAIKGVFTPADIELIQSVHPDIVYISNHGGRIPTRTGSTAEFLLHYHKEISTHCGEIWIDGGIRQPIDIATALALGAKQVLIGRPFISALCKGGTDELCACVDRLKETVSVEN